MLSKNTTVFLAIACAYWFLVRIYFEISFAVNGDHYRDNFLSIVSLGILLLFPVFFGLTAIFIRNGSTQPRKTMAICLAAISGIWIVSDSYHIYDSLTAMDTNRTGEFSVLTFFTGQLLALLFPVSLLLTGIAFSGDTIKRVQRNAIWLIAGSLVELFILFFSDVSDLAFYLVYARESSVMMVLNRFLVFLMLALPVASLLSGFSILRNCNRQLAEENPERTTDSAPTVIHWLKNYLLIAIPFAGLILLAFWSADTKNTVRRNWSMAMFLATIVATALNLFIYLPMLDLGDPTGTIYYAVACCIVLILIIAGSILLYQYNQQKFVEENAADENPSVWKWVANFLILAIPLIGIIMLIVWATDNRNRIVKNWAIARLIWLAISLLFTVYLYATILEIKGFQTFIYFQF